MLVDTIESSLLDADRAVMRRLEHAQHAAESNRCAASDYPNWALPLPCSKSAVEYLCALPHQPVPSRQTAHATCRRTAPERRTEADDAPIRQASVVGGDIQGKHATQTVTDNVYLASRMSAPVIGEARCGIVPASDHARVIQRVDTEPRRTQTSRKRQHGNAAHPDAMQHDDMIGGGGLHRVRFGRSDCLPLLGRRLDHGHMQFS